MLFNESLEGVLQEYSTKYTVSSALVGNGVEKNIIFGKTPTLASNERERGAQDEMKMFTYSSCLVYKRVHKPRLHVL